MNQLKQHEQQQTKQVSQQCFSQQVSVRELIADGRISVDATESIIKNNNSSLSIHVQGAIDTQSVMSSFGQEMDMQSLVPQSVQSTSCSQPQLCIGIDEAGRGPLLGSVVVAAVILKPEVSGNLHEHDLSNTSFAMLNDSKKLSEKKRNLLYEVIQQQALAYVLVDLPARVIDELNILQASLLGMRLAGDALLKQLSTVLQPRVLNKLQVQVNYDGNKLPMLESTCYQSWGYQQVSINHTAIVKGDSKVMEIAAASVLAKVHRDAQMYAMARQYPEYGIDKHKGYPTKQHLAMLAEHGVLPEHRRSFAPVSRLYVNHVNHESLESKTDGY